MSFSQTSIIVWSGSFMSYYMSNLKHSLHLCQRKTMIDCHQVYFMQMLLWIGLIKGLLKINTFRFFNLFFNTACCSLSSGDKQVTVSRGSYIVMHIKPTWSPNPVSFLVSSPVSLSKPTSVPFNPIHNVILEINDITWLDQRAGLCFVWAGDAFKGLLCDFST